MGLFIRKVMRKYYINEVINIYSNGNEGNKL
jgi:hypothetical protein